jgi:triphosphatase
MDENSNQFLQDVEGYPGLLPEDPIAEGGRKILNFQYQAIRFYEYQVRLGQDIESLHKMRVAVRRIRTAYQVFRHHIKKEVIQPYIKELRDLGDVLGYVRDLDVFLLNADLYKIKLGIDEQKAFNSIEDFFEQNRQQHRSNLFKTLGSRKYRNLCDGLSGLLTKPSELAKEVDERSTSGQIGFIAGEIIRRRYEKILGYERLNETEAIEHIHKIRIAVKAFRYSIEFFEEILGDKAMIVLESLITIQDYLGELNDRAVATRLMENMIKQKSLLGNYSDKVISKATEYLEYLRDDVAMRIEGFPSAWKIFHQPEFLSSLDELISN